MDLEICIPLAMTLLLVLSSKLHEYEDHLTSKRSEDEI
jgi:hypothetical protein